MIDQCTLRGVAAFLEENGDVNTLTEDLQRLKPGLGQEFYLLAYAITSRQGRPAVDARLLDGLPIGGSGRGPKR